MQRGHSASHTSKSLKSSRYFFAFPGKRRREAFEIQDERRAKTKTQNLASLQLASLQMAAANEMGSRVFPVEMWRGFQRKTPGAVYGMTLWHDAVGL